MRSRMISMALLAALAACATTVQQSEPASAPPPIPVRGFEPKIDLVSSSGGSIVRRGQDVRVRFRTTDDGYVMVGRIDTDGRFEVLYPRRPSESSHVWANQIYEVGPEVSRAFRVDDQPGIGYVFAIVSPTPLRLNQYAGGAGWDYHEAAIVRGDPYVAMNHMAQAVLFDANDYYSMDYFEYNV